MISREEALEPLVGPGATLDTVLDAFKDWEVVPGFIDGKHAATAVLKGTEIHFGIVPEFRRKAILRSRTQEFLRPMLERRGFLTTRVLLSAGHHKRFVERIGFKPTWADESFQYYLLGRVPFVRT